MSHAVVTVTDMTGTQVLRAEADAEGAVRDATALAPGAYTVIVTAVGYAPAAVQRDRHRERAGRGRHGDAGPAGRRRTAAARDRGPSTRRTPPWARSPSTWASPACTAGSPSSPAAIEIAPDEVAKSRVEAVIRAASIDTGNAMRDGHLRSADFLDVERTRRSPTARRALTPAGSDRWTVHGELTMHGVVRPVDLDLAYLGTGADPWGGTRAAFRATTELHREDFAMNYNQVVQAGIAAIGTTLKVELDIQAVQGETLPQA